MMQLDYTFERQLELERRDAWKDGFQIGFTTSLFRIYRREKGGTFEEFCELFDIDEELQEEICKLLKHQYSKNNVK